jgi:hypothetical protein
VAEARGPRRRKMSTVGSRYERTGEKKADRQDSVRAVVDCRVFVNYR